MPATPLGLSPGPVPGHLRDSCVLLPFATLSPFSVTASWPWEGPPLWELVPAGSSWDVRGAARPERTEGECLFSSGGRGRRPRLIKVDLEHGDTSASCQDTRLTTREEAWGSHCPRAMTSGPAQPRMALVPVGSWRHPPAGCRLAQRSLARVGPSGDFLVRFLLGEFMLCKACG